MRFDTFRTLGRSRARGCVTFALYPACSIERMTMRAVSPLADFGYDYHDLWFCPALQ